MCIYQKISLKIKNKKFKNKQISKDFHEPFLHVQNTKYTRTIISKINNR